jgi:hypothetical protein
MAKKYPAGSKKAKRVEEAKVAMNYRLSPAKIAHAQRILGTPTATATIEEALDLVVFRRELLDGLESASGLDVGAAFPDAAPAPRRRGR